MDPNTNSDSPGRSPLAGQGRRLTLLVCGAFVLGVAVTAVILWVSSLIQGDMPITTAVTVAALLGGGLTTAVAGGLMAALFHSDRSGWDREVK